VSADHLETAKYMAVDAGIASKDDLEKENYAMTAE